VSFRWIKVIMVGRIVFVDECDKRLNIYMMA
jgi:hypothetical protein